MEQTIAHPDTAVRQPLGEDVAPIVHVTRVLHFNAAHRMHNPEWSPEQNKDVFGLCNSDNWHGHNYELEITIKGKVDPGTGYVYDLSRLKQVVEKLVVDQLDHRNLNVDVDFMRGIIPSSENLAVLIWERLKNEVAPAELHCIRLYETPRNYVEYYGAREDIA